MRYAMPIVAGVAPRLASLTTLQVAVDPALSAAVRQGLAEIIGAEVSTSLAMPRSSNGLVYVGPKLPSSVAITDLAWFHSTNAGVDAVLEAREWPEEVLFTRTVGRMGRRIAEYVLAWMFANRQRTATYLEQHRQRIWERHNLRLIEGDLAVVFGTGRIGSAVAKLLRAAGLLVVGVATKRRHHPEFDEVVDIHEAPTHIAKAQWLVSTLPLTDQTAGFFDRTIFESSRGACFINVGRGATVVHEALRDALQQRRVRAAVLDVLPNEPPAADDRWWRLPHTVITSHTAGITADSDVIDAFRECWEALLKNERPALAVDPQRGY